jgi:hypothetical protein
VRKKIAIMAAAAALVAGPLVTAVDAQAAQSSQDTTTVGPTSTPGPTTPQIVQPLDCHGTTGAYGCGPGWIWNGNSCVPC